VVGHALERAVGADIPDTTAVRDVSGTEHLRFADIDPRCGGSRSRSIEGDCERRAEKVWPGLMRERRCSGDDKLGWDGNWN
jgi:hypothetical protein